MLAAVLGDLLQHRGERREAGAARQQQQRPLDFAQIERAKRAGQVDAVASLGKVGQKAAHQPARHVADQEADLAILLQRAEGVGAGLIAARHLQIDVLPGQERQLVQRFALDRQRNGALGQLAHIADRSLVVGLLGLADVRSGRHANHAVTFGAHLAGQYVALLGFGFAQRILDVFLAEVVAAALGEAFAGPAGAVTAIQRHVDALAVSGIGDGFA